MQNEPVTQLYVTCTLTELWLTEYLAQSQWYEWMNEMLVFIIIVCTIPCTLAFTNHDWLNIWPSHSGIWMNEWTKCYNVHNYCMYYTMHCICHFAPHPASVLATYLPQSANYISTERLNHAENKTKKTPPFQSVSGNPIIYNLLYSLLETLQAVVSPGQAHTWKHLRKFLFALCRQMFEYLTCIVSQPCKECDCSILEAPVYQWSSMLRDQWQ